MQIFVLKKSIKMFRYYEPAFKNMQRNLGSENVTQDLIQVNVFDINRSTFVKSYIVLGGLRK